MNKELMKIKEDLRQRSRREAYKLWRLAWRATEHGCSQDTIHKIREEADWCFRTGTAYPERLLTDQVRYELRYAFKC